VLHPEDRPQTLAAWRTGGGAEPFVAEVRLLRADGHVAWVRLNAAAMLDGTGCRGCAVEDITLRKDADAVLRAPKALFAEGAPR
jgi:PAS domain-containing protein